jgi:hypothetical protein
MVYSMKKLCLIVAAATLLITVALNRAAIATYSPLPVDAFGSLKMALYDSAGNAVDYTGATSVEPYGQTLTHITTNASTQVKTGAGTLVSVTINKKGATANTATLYDSAACSGTAIAVIDTTDRIGTLTYTGAFAAGLCVLTATGTAPDLTIASR